MLCYSTIRDNILYYLDSGHNREDSSGIGVVASQVVLPIMATIVYNVATNGTGLRGTLFEGMTFWLSQRVPQRARFVAEIEESMHA